MQKTVLELVVRRVPKPFWVELFHRIANVVSEARAIHDDTRFDRQELPQIEGQIRYAMTFKQLRRAAEAAGLHWEDAKTATGNFQYPVVSASPFMLTVSSIPAVNELPEPSDYRTSLAQALNAAHSRPKLRDRDRATDVAKPMYGIVIYTVNKPTGTAGYLGVGFPNEDYSAWLACFSMSELMEAYSRRDEEETTTVDDKVTPKIRRHKKEGGQD